MINHLEISKSVGEIETILRPISLHEEMLIKCALILTFYPLRKSKLNIYLNLDKVQRVGMLNRHILGAASKLGIHQVFIRQIIGLKRTNKKYKQNILKTDNKQFWTTAYNTNQIELRKMFNLLLDMMIEELDRRSEPKYLRRKKLNEIENKNV